MEKSRAFALILALMIAPAVAFAPSRTTVNLVVPTTVERLKQCVAPPSPLFMADDGDKAPTEDKLDDYMKSVMDQASDKAGLAALTSQDEMQAMLDDTPGFGEGAKQIVLTEDDFKNISNERDVRAPYRTFERKQSVLKTGWSMEDIPPRALCWLRVQKARKKYRLHDTDTGSPEYQVAGMTERISFLTKHMQKHPKDYSTRRGLLALVNKRRRLLTYLSRESRPRYDALVESLGIRHKPFVKYPDRITKYARFPPQKRIKTHLVGKNKSKSSKKKP